MKDEIDALKTQLKVLKKRKDLAMETLQFGRPAAKSRLAKLDAPDALKALLAVLDGLELSWYLHDTPTCTGGFRMASTKETGAFEASSELGFDAPAIVVGARSPECYVYLVQHGESWNVRVARSGEEGQAKAFSSLSEYLSEAVKNHFAHGWEWGEADQALEILAAPPEKPSFVVPGARVQSTGGYESGRGVVLARAIGERHGETIPMAKVQYDRGPLGWTPVRQLVVVEHDNYEILRADLSVLAEMDASTRRRTISNATYCLGLDSSGRMVQLESGERISYKPRHCLWRIDLLWSLSVSERLAHYVEDMKELTRPKEILARQEEAAMVLAQAKFRDDSASLATLLDPPLLADLLALPADKHPLAMNPDPNAPLVSIADSSTFDGRPSAGGNYNLDGDVLY